LPGDLAEANKRADALATKLEQSEKARKKAEEDAKKAKEDAATVGELRKRLHDAETSLSENITQQSAREQEILTRLESQCRRFISKCSDPCCFLVSCFFPFSFGQLFFTLFRENRSRI
jgi:uncharacterized membrane protein YcjF (UPF0283 family)